MNLNSELSYIAKQTEAQFQAITATGSRMPVLMLKKLACNLTITYKNMAPLMTIKDQSDISDIKNLHG